MGRITSGIKPAISECSTPRCASVVADAIIVIDVRGTMHLLLAEGSNLAI
jgi:hypothetical protein